VFNDLEGNVIDWALPSKRSRSTLFTVGAFKNSSANFVD